MQLALNCCFSCGAMSLLSAKRRRPMIHHNLLAYPTCYRRDCQNVSDPLSVRDGNSVSPLSWFVVNSPATALFSDEGTLLDSLLQNKRAWSLSSNFLSQSRRNKSLVGPDGQSLLVEEWLETCDIKTLRSRFIVLVTQGDQDRLKSLNPIPVPLRFCRRVPECVVWTPTNLCKEDAWVSLSDVPQLLRNQENPTDAGIQLRMLESILFLPLSRCGDTGPTNNVFLGGAAANALDGETRGLPVSVQSIRERCLKVIGSVFSYLACRAKPQQPLTAWEPLHTAESDGCFILEGQCVDGGWLFRVVVAEPEREHDTWYVSITDRSSYGLMGHLRSDGLFDLSRVAHTEPHHQRMPLVLAVEGAVNVWPIVTTALLCHVFRLLNGPSGVCEWQALARDEPRMQNVRHAVDQVSVLLNRAYEAVHKTERRVRHV